MSVFSSWPISRTLASTLPTASSIADIMAANCAALLVGDVREAVEVLLRRLQRRVLGVERQVEEARLVLLACRSSRRPARRRRRSCRSPGRRSFARRAKRANRRTASDGRTACWRACRRTRRSRASSGDTRACRPGATCRWRTSRSRAPSAGRRSSFPSSGRPACAGDAVELVAEARRVAARHQAGPRRAAVRAAT